ncbi:serine/threonine-protein kinase [uncultured Serinicoccus sp.]|uniref:serine/threonine-protein kinase n=1 Tax=uncultured Serinicoccus sp. TaxID=735514 RepID=UPI002623572A|nr:serine/threonine-protein kinase [uncultured Serinicoccus sp.]
MTTPARQVSAGRYTAQEVIGVGSFATVYRATDDRLDAPVVVKILAENHSLNPEVRERFITEGRALRRVSSPHVVTLFDIGENERQQPYHVLEHADRGTLAERVEGLRSTGWTASRAEVLVLARHLASALAAVHRAQLVHRDLSPANVLLSSSGATGAPGAGRRTGQQLVGEDERVLVADLGMCKDLAVSSGLTVAGGTTGFRPPEMRGGPALVDGRADLYSLSALLGWVCEDADLPPALGAVLDRGQAPDPEDRQPDVETWLTEVRAALEPAAGAGGSAPAPVPPGGRRRHRVQAAGAALLLALGAVLGWGAAAAGPDDRTSSASVGIAGPEDLTTGTSATFSIEQEGLESWVWLLPDGRFLSDEPSVTLSPTLPGQARLVLTGRDEQGRELRAVHRLSVASAQG